MTFRIMRFLMPFYAAAFIGMMAVGIVGKVTGWWEQAKIYPHPSPVPHHAGMISTNRTLGDIKRFGGDLSLYCNAARCMRQLDVTLDKLIDAFGADTVVIGKRWPVRCRSCGGRDIGMIYSPVRPKSGHPAPTWGMMPPSSTGDAP